MMAKIQRPGVGSSSDQPIIIKAKQLRKHAKLGMKSIWFALLRICSSQSLQDIQFIVNLMQNHITVLMNLNFFCFLNDYPDLSEQHFAAQSRQQE